MFPAAPTSMRCFISGFLPKSERIRALLLSVYVGSEKVFILLYYVLEKKRLFFKVKRKVDLEKFTLMNSKKVNLVSQLLISPHK